MEKLKEPSIGTHKSFRVHVYYVCDLKSLIEIGEKYSHSWTWECEFMDTNLVDFSPYIPPNKSQIAI